MFIVVSNDPRMPFDLKDQGAQAEKWTVDEFIEHAMAGLDIDEGLYYDVSELSEEVYGALCNYDGDERFNVVYYRFDDRPEPDFKIAHGIKVFETVSHAPTVEVKEPEPEPVKAIKEVPIPEPEPVPEPEPIKVPEPEPEPEPAPVPVQPTYVPPVQPTYTPPVQPEPVQSVPVQPAPPVQPTYTQPSTPVQTESKKGAAKSVDDKIIKLNINNLLQVDDFDSENERSRRKKKAPAKVILFGSSKGGTGKTFTCLASVYWYGKTHPNEKIAIADFDIIDGQIGITINKLGPTILDYYKLAKSGRNEFQYLENCKVKSDHFSPNIDFYLAPSQDIPKVTNDLEFWNDVFTKLIENYDIVFFDSGIDYLGKQPISQLYKIADKIFITNNPSINSTKSVIKQFKTLSGQRVNQVFKPSDGILKRSKVIITRAYENNDDINNIVASNISLFVPIAATFGNIDTIISEIQWYQRWSLIDEHPEIYNQLDKIIDFTDIDDND